MLDEKDLDMIIKDKIPEHFYKLFRTKNMNHYMNFLVALYDENNDIFYSMGLTVTQCRQIIAQQMGSNKVMWEPEMIDEEDVEDREDCQQSKELFEMTASPTTIVSRLIAWGWIRTDYDEKINEYIISFPEYSQLYIELFKELLVDDSEKERQSILGVYSSLYTYVSDKDKNNDILKNAFKTSRDLGQLLSNMQDSMRAYFDELSRRKDFIGVQEVLVKELNNSDSKKYAILTTTDSFYRYKEAIKELVSEIIGDIDDRKSSYLKKQSLYEQDTRQFIILKRAIEQCDEASQIIYRIEREFNIIERKYNRLIEQKTIFAKRALARIHYILAEGISSEDNTLRLIAKINNATNQDKLLNELADKLYFTSQYKTMNQNSMYNKRDSEPPKFQPIAVASEESTSITDYVPKPLYTKAELEEFKNKHTKNGIFVADASTVEDISDLEKLMFIWHEAINDDENNLDVNVAEEVKKDGFRYSRLTIEKK